MGLVRLFEGYCAYHRIKQAEKAYRNALKLERVDIITKWVIATNAANNYYESRVKFYQLMLKNVKNEKTETRLKAKLRIPDFLTENVIRDLKT